MRVLMPDGRTMTVKPLAPPRLLMGVAIVEATLTVEDTSTDGFIEWFTFCVRHRFVRKPEGSK